MTQYVDAWNCVPPSRRGFMLVTVLIITAVGLLFGAGALLLFRYQCQLRIDRQHELEKVYAVRSALNYVRTYDDNGIDAGMSFKYHTASERDLELCVKPSRRIFPDLANPEHLDIGNEGNHGRTFQLQEPSRYNPALDYEYGVKGMTNAQIQTTVYNGDTGLKFGDLKETANVTWWVNIGMRGTGGWLQDDYGRRYFFYPVAYVNNKDIMRLCIIRNVTNDYDDAGTRLQPGHRRGWPLSRNGERALVLEIRPTGGVLDNAYVSLSEHVRDNGFVSTNWLIRLGNYPAKRYMGLQLAHDKVAIFNVENAAHNTHVLSSRGYDLSSVTNISVGTYNYFAAGSVVAADGKIEKAPELRVVLEVEADLNARGPGVDASQLDFLTRLRVTPAYQYDIFVVHPALVTNLATVAQKVGEWNRKGTQYSILTYDTHGTDHKGFRQDEKEWAAKRGGGN